MSGANGDMGDDLDEELLALAGGDSDDEEVEEEYGEEEVESEDEVARPGPKSTSPSASPPRPSIEKPTPASPPTTSTPVAKSQPSTTSKPSAIPVEASPEPGSPQSLGSDAMDESDAESDAYSDRGGQDDGNEFPLEGIYRDTKEKAKIRAMPELQREQLLEERRHHKQEREKTDNLRRALAAADAQKDSKKRKAAVADLDDGPAKARPKDKRAEALEDLKRSREKRDTGRRMPTSGKKDRRSRSRSSDADGESDEAEFVEDPIRVAPKASPDATLREIERLRLGRNRFQQYCFYPTFEDLTGECFVRVQVTNGVYKMGQIKSYSTGKPYTMEGTNGRPIMNDQYAEVFTGEKSHPWPLTHCSNSPFTLQEYEEWKSALRTTGKRLPTQQWADRKCDDLHSLVKTTLSNAEIDAKIKKQNKLAHLLAARNAGKPAVLNEHQIRQQKIADLNLRNKQENKTQIRNALLHNINKERAAGRKAMAVREEAERKAAADLAAKTNNKVDDLFEGGSDVSRAATPSNAEKKVAPAPRKGMPQFTRRKMDDEIISQMDFGIEIDI